jgi:putative FmdB family regulatory protein
MPIYEYESLEPSKSCKKCAHRFEVFQGIAEEPLSDCPYCGQKVRKIISLCRAAIVETSDEHAMVERQISKYEKEGMWSHAAELADKHSEKIKDKNIKMRALDNYRKAGYDADSLDKHVKMNDS